MGWIEAVLFMKKGCTVGRPIQSNVSLRLSYFGFVREVGRESEPVQLTADEFLASDWEITGRLDTRLDDAIEEMRGN